MKEELTDKPARLEYNLGVYQIRKLVGTEWVFVYPEISGTYARCYRQLMAVAEENPHAVYCLFHLEEINDGEVVWVKTEHSKNYASRNRNKLLELFFQMGLRLDGRSYKVLSEITGISHHSLEKLNRPIQSDRFASLSDQGLLYIRHKVDKHLQDVKKRGNENDESEA
ncbi:hypothetical protein [uncultured Amphritea sp.]|uniref:hypothetical protein n=1 Tax=uncultured Amphritea sp. TaxID=981605 RepID=UPI00260896A9|nr:hypothetical protein [uncultured Amphritea sp.]